MSSGAVSLLRFALSYFCKFERYIDDTALEAAGAGGHEALLMAVLEHHGVARVSQDFHSDLARSFEFRFKRAISAAAEHGHFDLILNLHSYLSPGPLWEVSFFACDLSTPFLRKKSSSVMREVGMSPLPRRF
jgi:hypothetical protein